ncbi:PLD nuclease N-terminal domain-containing protein [Halosegnis sp.]|uniref:PLD nuclease N-terminal domain-containing protein n=1 Tax=Halosegnis sp. TaxID=2864959 RepID=UPI0035D49ADC
MYAHTAPDGAGPLLVGLLSFLLLIAAIVWTYRDAKENSDQPAWLWALVVFLAPLLGIVLYVLLGRD